MARDRFHTERLNMDDIYVLENFIEKEDAETIIKEIDNPSKTLPYPEYYSNRNGGTALPYNETVVSILKKYAIKSSNAHKNFFNVKDVFTTKGYSSKWRTGDKGEVHIDDVDKETFIEWSTVIYLNEPPEFTGGNIYFPYKDFEYIPVKYSAVFFPQGNRPDLQHGISEVTSGYRYTLLFHHSSKKEFADPDLIEEV